MFSSTREVYGDVHRFEEYAEEAADFAFTESPYSASKITSEAFIYSYARCYGLDYLVFRFSNVYGRYDIDLQRMDRVLPLFMHQLSRGEPITIYGGDEKVLDFTYVDDCVDGIARGVDALADGARHERDDEPRLRPGQHARARGRADRRRARRRAADHDRTVADGRGDALRRRRPKARDAARLEPPTTPLDEGIPKAVAWFREWRAAHPEEDRPFVRPETRMSSSMASSSLPPPRLSRPRALRPDGVGQDRRRAASCASGSARR